MRLFYTITSICFIAMAIAYFYLAFRGGDEQTHTRALLYLILGFILDLHAKNAEMP